jgi:hypothetical protein
LSTVASPSPLRLMVASSVYGFQTELDQICGVLLGYGYTVSNSHIGTIVPHPGRSNLDNCLEAVRQCDVFLGIVRPFYGSGKIGPRSITHEEMRLAIELNKPRWFLVHGHVTFARQLLRQYRSFNQGKPWVPTWLMKLLGFSRFSFEKTAVMDDLRVIDMYDDVTRADQPVAARTGNWAQEFYSLGQALQHIETVFSNPGWVRQVVSEMHTS